ncbi:hypothetical protein ACFOLD_06520 [Kocuria carniphila]|uniref:hypothetical protein n=1 Tax=Kocuria carniphila TaxID=262208 RepID=UPI003613191B
MTPEDEDHGAATAEGGGAASSSSVVASRLARNAGTQETQKPINANGRPPETGDRPSKSAT